MNKVLIFNSVLIGFVVFATIKRIFKNSNLGKILGAIGFIVAVLLYGSLLIWVEDGSSEIPNFLIVVIMLVPILLALLWKVLEYVFNDKKIDS